MDKLLIQGGHSLQGRLRIAGAKNAVLPIMIASLMTADEVTLRNIPHLKDVTQTMQLLANLGVERTFNYEKELTITLKSDQLISLSPNAELVQSMRASVLLLGPLLARFGEVKLYQPGGCVIGSRPINLHLDAMQALGAEIVTEGDYVIAKADKLIGAVIEFPLITVTGTENTICAACLAEGETIIKNAAIEPEVTDLINCLTSMGARIQRINTNTLAIQGVKQLHGTDYCAIADRIEAGTYLTAVAMTGGCVEFQGVPVQSMNNIIDLLRRTKTQIDVYDDMVVVQGNAEKLQGISFQTAPYPGFPTDMQAQLMALNCIANGPSVIEDRVFKNRFHHVEELKKMGAQLHLHQHQHRVTCQGNTRLIGAGTIASDLRASACLILAALVAEGESIIRQIQHIDRGYELIEEKLAKLGASIYRLHDYTETPVI